MTDWNTAEALSNQYAVSSASLRSHAARGNLASTLTTSGVRLFDERRVAALFRRRDQNPRELGLAVLGESRLGTRIGPNKQAARGASQAFAAWL